LATALSEADRGESAALVQWVNRADPLKRQQVAHLVERAAVGESQDIRQVYAARGRLLPFTVIPTGNARLDHDLDNLVAYALVAGTASPTADDLMHAKAIATRLAPAAFKTKDHPVLDTIGCVRFRLAEAKPAEEAFAKALEIAQAAKESDKTLDLYRRRLAAAQRLATNPAEPLPLDHPTP
jgi:hypothetical protein